MYHMYCLYCLYFLYCLYQIRSAILQSGVLQNTAVLKALQDLNPAYTLILLVLPVLPVRSVLPVPDTLRHLGEWRATEHCRAGSPARPETQQGLGAGAVSFRWARSFLHFVSPRLIITLFFLLCLVVGCVQHSLWCGVGWRGPTPSPFRVFRVAGGVLGFRV